MRPKGGISKKAWGAKGAEMKAIAAARRAAANANGRSVDRAKRKLAPQLKEANVRAKYGRAGRPAPVVVKSMDGEVLRIVDQRVITGRLRPGRRA